jgi:hypothetical protein
MIFCRRTVDPDCLHTPETAWFGLFLLRQTISDLEIIAFRRAMDVARHFEPAGTIDRAGHDAGSGATEGAPEHRASTAIAKAAFSFVRRAIPSNCVQLYEFQIIVIASRRSAMVAAGFAALAAMTRNHIAERARNFVGNAAAKAAAMDSRHDRTPNSMIRGSNPLN